MYVDDERFTEFYDKVQPGAAEFLRDAVIIYAGMNK
jgi:acetoin utilization deacetylase AcuC-like enzyme